jgi:hypothetical protein
MLGEIACREDSILGASRKLVNDDSEATAPGSMVARKTHAAA